MSEIRATIGMDEIARRLGVPKKTLYNNMRRLRASGFPVPLPGLAHRYDPAAIAAWQDRHIPREAGLIADTGNDDGDRDPVPDAAALAAARARMDARAGGGA